MRSTATAAEVTIRPATVAELRRHGSDLFAASWAEIEGDGVLNVDWKQYGLLEDAGLLFVRSAWVGDEMVGYSVALALPGLHTSDLGGDLLSMFVKPECRRLGIGLRMIRETQAWADDIGAKMRWHTKRGHTLDLVMRRLGYDEQDEVVYVKRGAP